MRMMGGWARGWEALPIRQSLILTASTIGMLLFALLFSLCWSRGVTGYAFSEEKMMIPPTVIWLDKARWQQKSQDTVLPFSNHQKTKEIGNTSKGPISGTSNVTCLVAIVLGPFCCSTQI